MRCIRNLVTPGVLSCNGALDAGAGSNGLDAEQRCWIARVGCQCGVADVVRCLCVICYHFGMWDMHFEI